MPTVISHSDNETQQIAAKFAATLQPGDIVTLTGELGAGKTTFTKGVAIELGIRKEITSPTFVIMNTYEVRIQTSDIRHLVHIDTYRLKSAEELREIGVEEYLGAPQTVTIIEWPEMATPLLAGKKIRHVLLEHTPSGERQITIT